MVLDNKRKGCKHKIGMIVLVILLFAGGTGAVPVEEWNRTFGGAGDDIAHSVQQTSDGGYILTGWNRVVRGRQKRCMAH